MVTMSPWFNVYLGLSPARAYVEVSRQGGSAASGVGCFSAARDDVVYEKGWFVLMVTGCCGFKWELR